MVALFVNLFSQAGSKVNINPLFLEVASIIVFVLIVFIATKLSALLITSIISKRFKNSNTIWKIVFTESTFFSRCLRIIPAVAAYVLLLLFYPHNNVYLFFQRLILSCIALMTASICCAFIDGVHIFYQRRYTERSKRKPLKSYAQIIKIFFYVVGVILSITTIVKVSPVGILSGLGAASAVLLLVFKDSILGFVSNIQLSENDLVRIGDWIEMPKYNADGLIVDITLQIVKVQNWDNTIITVPIYSLISDSFKNWRGMSESGGRRIKRSLYIDARTVRFLSKEEVKKLSKISLIADYMNKKIDETSAHNKKLDFSKYNYISGRYLTNLGTYRTYAEKYIASLPTTAKDLTTMVRYLKNDQNGLEMEFYLFSSDKKWKNYEHFQADIIDHLLAVMPEFGLKIFQNPSGADLELIAKNSKRENL
ncbi:MAG: mechanosensitive ion channel family protein [Elusimicrobiota bacterium]|nr:mechanosensitive ion channel family protein [Elusimicrobiota bacterium]